MKVLIITPYYPPEVGAAQTRLSELSSRLYRLGHEVSVLTTFPSYPTGIVPKQWRKKLYATEVTEGVRVFRTWSYPAPNHAFLKRVLGHLSFGFSAAIAGALLPAVDVIVVQSPPLFDSIAALFLRATKRERFVFMVSDLWPESAIQMGALRSSLLIWAMKRLELTSYNHSSLVLALTAGIRDKIVANGMPPNKVMLFRNSVECEIFRPGIDGSAIRREFGVREDDFLVVYAGILGYAQHLSTVLEAAALVQAEGAQNIRFLLVGDGAEYQMLKSQAAALELTNLHMPGVMPKARMPELLNAADSVLVPLRKLELFRGALPSKMFEAMACAKPVILGVNGEAQDVLKEAGAGVCVSPESPAAIRSAVLQLRSDPDRARAMGRFGRQYVVQHFNRDRRALFLSELLELAAFDHVLPNTVAPSEHLSVAKTSDVAAD